MLLVAVTMLSFNSFFNAFRQEKENSTRTLIAQVVVSSILPITYDGKTLGYLQGDIDYEVLRRLLDTIYRQNDIEISIITADGVVVFDRNRGQVNSRVDPKILTQLVGTEGSFAADWQRESALIVYRRSAITNWFLVASIPYVALLKPSYAVSTNILFVILPLSLVVALLVFFLIARQLRQPWNRLIRRMETATVANYRPADIDYGVGEIAELGNRFETMLAQNSDLIERIYVADIKQKNPNCRRCANRSRRTLYITSRRCST